MIDVTTKAGMDRIMELYARMPVSQIILTEGLAVSEKNLKHRIKRYQRDGAVIYRRMCMPEDVIKSLAVSGICVAEAARRIGATPVQVARASRYYGIPFVKERSGVKAIEKPAKYDPPPSACIPTEIRQLLRQPWVSPAVRHISASRFLV